MADHVSQTDYSHIHVLAQLDTLVITVKYSTHASIINVKMAQLLSQMVTHANVYAQHSIQETIAKHTIMLAEAAHV